MTRLSKNIVYNLAGQLVLLVLGFVAARYVARGLGGDVLGLIYFAAMLNTIVTAVLEMGVCTTTVKEIAANEVADPKYVVRLVRSGAFLYWIAYIGVAAGTVILAPTIVERWIKLETMAPDAAIYLLRVLIVSALLGLPRAFYESVFNGLQKMHIPNAVSVGTTTVQQVGSIAIIATTADARLVAQWMASLYVVRILIYLVLVARNLGARAIIPKLYRSVLRRNRKFATSMVAISILAMVQTQADKVVIAALMPVAEVGIYGLLYGSALRAGILTGSVAGAALPKLSELLNAAREHEAQAQYRKLQDLLCFGLAPLFALLAFASRPLFTAILNADVGARIVLPATLLSIGFYLNGTLTIPYYYSLASGKPEIATRLNFYGLVVTLPLTVLLTWKLGLAGAAGAWVAYQLFSLAYAVPRICRDCLHVSARSWYAHLAGFLGVITVSYGAAGLIVHLIAEPSMLALLIAYCLGTLVFLFGGWLLVDRESKNAAFDFARSLSAQLKQSRG